MFQNTTSTFREVVRALEAMKLITTLSGEAIAEENRHLFRIIMKAPTSHVCSSWKWEAAGLAMNGAYKCDKFLPEFENPQFLLDFLNHHFENVDKKSTQEGMQAIQNALRALAYPSSPRTIGGLINLGNLFVRGVCLAF